MGVWTTALEAWPVGRRITSALIRAQLRDFGNAFGAMQSYTPTWSATGFAFGNAGTAGAYTQVQKTVWFRATLTLGSATTPGTGPFSVTLPAASASGVRWHIGALLFDSSTGDLYRLVGQISGGASTCNLYRDGSPLGAFSGTAPIALGTLDTINVTGWYEAA